MGADIAVDSWPDGTPRLGVGAACELCRADRITHWYGEDDYGWVADCEICDTPMVVWRQHGVTPPETVVEHLVACLSAAATQRYGIGRFSVDRHMRQIPDHFHAHARPHASIS